MQGMDGAAPITRASRPARPRSRPGGAARQQRSWAVTGRSRGGTLGIVVTGGSQRVLRPGREGRHILTSVAEHVSPSGFVWAERPFAGVVARWIDATSSGCRKFSRLINPAPVGRGLVQQRVRHGPEQRVRWKCRRAQGVALDAPRRPCRLGQLRGLDRLSGLGPPGGNGQHGPRIGHDRRGLRSTHWPVPQVPGPPPARRQC